MPKKPTKRRTMGEKVTAVEVEVRREQQTLRRLRDQQKRIVSLSRELRRAVRTADGARLEAARELCADTGFAVFGIVEIEIRERQLEEARARVDELTLRVQELTAARELAPA